MINRHSLRWTLEHFGLLILLGLIVLFFTVNPSTSEFASAANITNILGNESILAILAIATVVPLVAGQIDLSVGPTAGLVAVITAGLMSKSGFALVPAALCGIGVGLAIGLVNGFLVTRVGVNSIVTTLGMSSIIFAIVSWYASGLSITSGLSSILTDFGSGKWLGIPKVFYVLLIIAAVAWYLLEHTPWGRYLHGCGTSPRAAELVGLPVKNIVLSSFLLTGALSAVGGIALVAVIGGGSPQIGPNFTLPAIAAAFLGATAIRPRRYNVLGTLLAVFFVAVSVNGLTLLGAEPWVSDGFNGVALIFAVALSLGFGDLGRRRRRRSGSDAPTTGPPAAESSVQQTAASA
jgi:ribose transport system permease protein